MSYKAIKRAIDVGEEIVAFGTTWAGPALIHNSILSAVDEPVAQPPLKKRRVRQSEDRPPDRRVRQDEFNIVSQSQVEETRPKSGHRRMPPMMMTSRAGTRTYKKKGSLLKPLMKKEVKKIVNMVSMSKAETLKWPLVRNLNLLTDSTVGSFGISQVPERTGTTLADVKTKRSGTEIYVSGIACEFHFQNLFDALAINVRVIIGWKKNKRAFADIDSIFYDPTTDTNGTLVASSPAYAHNIFAKTDARCLHKVHDMTFKLAGELESTEGANSKSFKLWVPINKKIRFEGLGEGFESQTIDPHVWIYATNETGTAVAVLDIVKYSFLSRTYFKDS